jgi:hypothetical protein
MIKIEVTGNSIGEVADKLLAIGGSLRNTAVNALDNSAREALQAKRDAAKAEVAEQAPADPTPTPNAPPVEETASSTTVDTPTPVAAAEASASDTLDFDLDVAPVVLRAVAAKGKPFVQEILSEFGGTRASDLDDARWPELIARLEAEMA